MLSDDNGCMCGSIQNPGEPFKKCIACRAREESAAKHKCKDCGAGLMVGNEREMSTRQCSNCYYN